MAKLTAKECESAKATPGKDRLLGDGHGLYLRIRPSGAKSWQIEYLHRGQRRKCTIGSFDSQGAPGQSLDVWLVHGRLSLTQARSIAGQWWQERRAGRDPIVNRAADLQQVQARAEAAKTAAEQEAAQPTVSDAIDVFASKHLDGKKSASAMRYRLTRLSQLVGELKLRDVTRPQIVEALETIAEGRSEKRTAKQLAGEVLVQTKRLWRFAESRGWIAESCVESLCRADFDARPRKRDVALRLDEVVEVWRALGDPDRCRADKVTIAALRILILTGQREREVTDAEWSEIDLKAGLWAIPAHRAKTGRSHVVHLAPQAIDVLTNLSMIANGRKHVFPSPLRVGQAIYGRSVCNALNLMFARQALPRVTRCHVHDLRRTLITRLPDLGFEPFIAHKIANHVLPGVLAHYNYNEYMDQRRAALLKWAHTIETLSKPNVLTIHPLAA